ncbi:MAG: hypothetical protein Q8K99_05905 [Actinomycetota bacterium]|nr:hypothetical protein [Actinomycetota bacterium]
MKKSRIVLLVALLVCSLGLAGCGASASSLRDKGDVAGLVEMAKDRNLDYTKRSDAVAALGELGTPEAVDALLGLLESPDTASMAVGPLGVAGDARAVEPLLAYVATLDPATDTYDTLRKMELAALARAFGGLEDPRVLSALLEQVDAKRAVVFSVEALGEGLAGQGQAAVPELRKRLGSKDADVFGPASIGLAEILADSPDELSKMLASKKTFRIYVGVVRGWGSVPDADILAALEEFGDVKMANAILASGSEEAKAAATKWGTEHGYAIHEVQPWETAP